MFPFTIKALVILSVLHWETKVKSVITLQYRVKVIPWFCTAHLTAHNKMAAVKKSM